MNPKWLENNSSRQYMDPKHLSNNEIRPNPTRLTPAQHTGRRKRADRDPRIATLTVDRQSRSYMDLANLIPSSPDQRDSKPPRCSGIAASAREDHRRGLKKILCSSQDPRKPKPTRRGVLQEVQSKLILPASASTSTKTSPIVSSPRGSDLATLAAMVKRRKEEKLVRLKALLVESPLALDQTGRRRAKALACSVHSRTPAPLLEQAKANLNYQRSCRGLPPRLWHPRQGGQRATKA
ncbi:hypothetical protein DMENIID0001_015160 [Sergentomyia squamirostris]